MAGIELITREQLESTPKGAVESLLCQFWRDALDALCQDTSRTAATSDIISSHRELAGLFREFGGEKFAAISLVLETLTWETIYNISAVNIPEYNPDELLQGQKFSGTVIRSWSPNPNGFFVQFADGIRGYIKGSAVSNCPNSNESWRGMAVSGAKIVIEVLRVGKNGEVDFDIKFAEDEIVKVPSVGQSMAIIDALVGSRVKVEGNGYADY